MKRLAFMSSMAVLLFAMAGCEQEIASERKVDVKDDGTVKTQEKTVTRDSDGSTTVTEEKTTTKP